ncbi:MAG: hypothetical protein Q8P67_20850, partial [archaeon]|nr:hypothetical protein [archaeon]
RILSVVATSVVSFFVCFAFALPRVTVLETLSYLGFHHSLRGEIAALVLPLLSISLLFLGPLLMAALHDPVCFFHSSSMHPRY